MLQLKPTIPNGLAANAETMAAQRKTVKLWRFGDRSIIFEFPLFNSKSIIEIAGFGDRPID